MMRLDIKQELIENCCSLFSRISYFDKCLPRSFVRSARRTILKDFKKGLRQINKKVEVYIELPNIKKVAEGMVRAEEPNKKVGSSDLVIVDEKAITKVKDITFTAQKSKNITKG